MSSRLAMGAESSEVARLQTAINAYLEKNHITVPSIGSDNKLTVDSKFGKQTRDALTAIQRHQRAQQHDMKVDGVYGQQTARLLAPLMGGATEPERAMREPQRESATTGRRRPAPPANEDEATSTRAAENAPARRRSGSGFEMSELRAQGPNLGIKHITQPDSVTCKPTTTKMIQNAGGHVGRERVGPGDNMVLDGRTLQRLLTQLQSGGVMAGVRSRNAPGGANRGSTNGHVIALSGYQFVDRNGRSASDSAVRAAVSAAGGRWDRLLGSLGERGIHLRLNTNDPGISSQPGARSYLDVSERGLISRPALGPGRVSLGYYTVRYLMLD